MIDIEDLVTKYKNDEDNSYLYYIQRKYNEFMLISDLPVAYRNHNIDVDKLPGRLKILNDNIFDIVNNRYSYVFNVAKYKDTGNLSSLLLDTYFTQCIKEDHYVEGIVYIDTNLILEDYKKLMDLQGGDMQISLAHSNETLSRNLENAPFVIWDKFSLVNSNYDKQKLYNILLTRARKDLGNMFFIKDATYVLANVFNDEMYDVMDTEQIVDISQQKLIYKNSNRSGGAKW